MAEKVKVYILDNGWLECDKNAMVSGSTQGTKSQPLIVNTWIKIPVMAVLIDHPEGKILYDTGCHPQAMEGYWPKNLQEVFPYYREPEQSLEKQLALCGVQPEDIQTVVLSHMHLDHAGNINLFRHADVYVHKNDYEYGMRLVHQSTDRNRHGAYIKEDLEVPVYQYHFVDEDVQLLPKVTLLSLPGHTPGILGVMVELEESGVMIFPQDSVYTRENYGPPARGAGIMYDSVAYYKSIEKIRNLAKQYQAQIIFAHDMEFFQTLKKAPEYYM